jgi:hypothetical protein
MYQLCFSNLITWIIEVNRYRDKKNEFMNIGLFYFAFCLS